MLVKEFKGHKLSNAATAVVFYYPEVTNGGDLVEDTARMAEDIKSGKRIAYEAYSKHVGDSIRTLQGGSDYYQYFFMDWYLMPQLLDKPCWTEPYMDLDAPTNTYEMVTSYCQAIKNKQGEFIGVINTSLSLNWLSHTISAVKPYPNSYSIMIGRGGTYFVHPDTTKITRHTIFTQTMENPDTAMTALGHAMQRGEEGMKRMTIDDKDCYVFYKPLGKTGCSMAIVCPESDIFGGFDRLRHTVMGIVFVGLLLMLYFFIKIITRELSPLHRLAKEAETIASGQFDTKLPDFQRNDEIGQLSHSFGNMQQSLVRYIDELKETTAQKASIESELNVASNIQMSMLPSVFPDREGLDMYASMTPAKEVGGDLYGYLLKDEKLYFCVGDVSGKGVPASLFMAQVTRLFRTLANQMIQPADICTQMNEALSGEENQTCMFVTLFIGLVDLKTGHLSFCNAGHNPPVIGGGEHHGEFLQMLPNFPIGSSMRARGCSARTILRMRSISSALTSDALLSSIMLQNSICWMTRFSRSSSPIFFLTRSSPQPNSSRMRKASTTVTMQSRSGMPSLLYLASICGIEQMVWAMGPGSQIPLASITM